jgi:hypothetical protein
MGWGDGRAVGINDRRRSCDGYSQNQIRREFKRNGAGIQGSKEARGVGRGGCGREVRVVS